MSQKPNIPIQKTIQFLQEKLNDEISEVTLLSGGEWSQAYSFIHQHKKYVLRWCHSAETFEKDAFAASFNSPDLPIPKIIDSGTAYDTEFAISEFAQGTFIEKLSSAELEQALPALFKLFDGLRTADLSNTTGFGGWDKNGVGSHRSWKEYLLDVKNDDGKGVTSGWYANLTSSTLGTKDFDQLYSQLESMIEKCPESRELIHADLLNSNVLFSNGHVSAVIDWQCALYGDSLYDLAWFTYYAPWYPQFETVKLCEQALSHFEAKASHTSNLKERLLCYQLHIGLGSIAYNAFKKDWQAVQEVIEYTLNANRHS